MSATWSNNPNAPQISHQMYYMEKYAVAGFFLGSIFRGIVIALFVQCMTALLSPTNRAKGGIRWGLTSSTVALMSVATMSFVMGLWIFPVAFINNREFPGGGLVLPGPLGYMWLRKWTTIGTISDAGYQVNQWLVDGLLLSRCYHIYGMSYWAVALPFMMYLASWATGIGFIYANTQQTGPEVFLNQNWGNAYYSIAFSLNVLLTLMIITRLFRHRKNIRRALGDQGGAGGLYKEIITMFVESGALYAASYALFFGPWACGSNAIPAMVPILYEVQCIAPFLIVLRIARRTALTSDIVSGNITSIRFRSQWESTGGDQTISNGNTIHSASDEHGETPEERNTGAENAIGRVPP